LIKLSAFKKVNGIFSHVNPVGRPSVSSLFWQKNKLTIIDQLIFSAPQKASAINIQKQIHAFVDVRVNAYIRNGHANCFRDNLINTVNKMWLQISSSYSYIRKALI